jgi:hypothetical protein
MVNRRAKLRAGIDYYLEAGNLVFTAAFHLQRGHCCQSVCRHCPYGNSPADRKRQAAAEPPHDARDSN